MSSAALAVTTDSSVVMMAMAEPLCSPKVSIVPPS